MVNSRDVQLCICLLLVASVLSLAAVMQGLVEHVRAQTISGLRIFGKARSTGSTQRGSTMAVQKTASTRKPNDNAPSVPNSIRMLVDELA